MDDRDHDAPAALGEHEFAELEALLMKLRARWDSIPRWEFCEGFLAALVCCRRSIPAAEYLPVLLAATPAGAQWADAAEQQRFMELWERRWSLVAQALDTQVAALDQPGAYQPHVADAHAGVLPSFGQLWAMGFMAAVQAWPAEWAGPRNKAAAQWRTAALGAIEALALPDSYPPTMSAFDDGGGPPTVSHQRMDVFAAAIWAVYSMRKMWRSLGPRIETVHKMAAPGRNDPCACGSGRKYKKCCARASGSTL
jgi:uncharacterized protein